MNNQMLSWSEYLDRAFDQGQLGFVVQAKCPIVCQSVYEDGVLSHHPVTSEDVTRLFKSAAPDQNQQELHENGCTIFSREHFGKGMYRVTALRCARGIELRVTLFPPQLPESHALLNDWVHPTSGGVFLITGIPRSGRTTSLAHLLQERANHRPLSGFVVSDGFGYELPKVASLRLGREIPSVSDASRVAIGGGFFTVGFDCLQTSTVLDTAFRLADCGVDAVMTFPISHPKHVIPVVGEMLMETRGISTEAAFRVIRRSLRAFSFQRVVPRYDGKGLVAAMELTTVDALSRSRLKPNMDIDKWSHWGSMLDQRLVDLVNQGVISSKTALEYCFDSRRIHRESSGQHE